MIIYFIIAIYFIVRIDTDRLKCGPTRGTDMPGKLSCDSAVNTWYYDVVITTYLHLVGRQAQS